VRGGGFCGRQVAAHAGGWHDEKSSLPDCACCERDRFLGWLQ
jgi:hypothetical protein